MVDVNATALYRDFWTVFGDRVSNRAGTPLYLPADEDLGENHLPQKANLPDGINYTLVSNMNEEYFQVKFHIWEQYERRDDLYSYLHARKQDIESVLGQSLQWNSNDSFDAIILQRDGDVTDRERWDEYLDWLIRYGEMFHMLFGSYVREFER